MVSNVEVNNSVTMSTLELDEFWSSKYKIGTNLRKKAFKYTFAIIPNQVNWIMYLNSYYTLSIKVSVLDVEFLSQTRYL